MKYASALLFIFAFSLFGFSQNIKLTGTMFAPNGALISNGQITAIDANERSTQGKSNDEGGFIIDLMPGLYSIEVAAPGFLTIKYTEFLVINSTTGKMTTDFVLFGAKYHEPCGVSGANCLQAKSLIRSYKVSYSPKLKDIRDEFAPEDKKDSKQKK